MIQRIFAAFCMCLDTYTCISLPKYGRDEDLRRVSDAFLPLVGLLIGLLWWLVAALSRMLLPSFLGAALMAVFPFIITGFFHLQGFSATGERLLALRRNDAAFGAILPAMLLLFQFTSCLSIEHIFPLAMLPVLSRACMALGFLAPKADEDEDGEIPASLLRIEKCIAAGALVLMLFSGWGGLLSGAAALGGYALCSKMERHTATSNADFALTVSELCGLVVLAIV